jgi:RNA polymerase sigma factor (sigma-70 family)
MPDMKLSPVLRHIRKVAVTRTGSEPTDADLLARFSKERDEGAFGALVERHGQMVFGVCRKLLRQQQDAEDAFQATFLVLARKAASIRWQESVGNYLYGVAYRVSAKARVAAGRRHAHERKAGRMTIAKPDLEWAFREVESVLAEEVGRLPQKYRAAFVCCCLEGMSKSEAAVHLGWKEGTVSGRLAEARKRLQQRLARRGISLATALCAGGVTATVQAAINRPLVQTTIQAALGIAAGKMAAGVSTRVAALVEGVTKAMFMSKLKLAALIAITAGAIAAGGFRLGHTTAASAAVLETALPGAEEERANIARKSSEPAGPVEGEVLVHGHVFDPDGKPHAGAGVLMVPVAEDQANRSAPSFLARTDAEGRFEFKAKGSGLVEGRQLVAVADGFGAAWIEANKLGKGEITLRLVKDLPIEGRILDLEGRPVRGAAVRVNAVLAAEGDDLTTVLKKWEPDSNRISQLLTKGLYAVSQAAIIPAVTTDASGRFRLRGVGRERVAELRVEGPTIEHKTLYIMGRSSVNTKELTKPEKRRPGMPRFQLPCIYGPTFDHTAGPTKPLVGTVRDKATGKPLAGVAVNGSASGNWWQDYVLGKTDAEGRYRLVGLPVANSYFVTSYDASDKGYLPGGQRIGGSEGVTPLTLDFEMVQGVRVSGRITDKETGKPVSVALWYTPLADNAVFKTLPNQEWYRSVSQGLRNDKDGRFHLVALPGSGLIKFRAEVAGENPYLQAVIAPGDRKKAYSLETTGMGQSFLSAGGSIESLFDANAYRLIDPAEGTETYNCDIELVRGKVLTGTVLDPNGKPLAGASAGGLTPSGGAVHLKDAAFTAKALNPAQPRLVAFFHKGSKAVGHVVLGGEEKGPLKVRLQPWGTVTGRVLDEDNKPVAEALVSVGYEDNCVRWLSDAMLGTIQTDAEGRFRVEGIMPGMEFGVGFRKGQNFLDAGDSLRKLKIESGATKDLGNIATKVFRVP